jgi:hypothetical protein
MSFGIFVNRSTCAEKIETAPTDDGLDITDIQKISFLSFFVLFNASGSMQIQVGRI